MTPAAFPESNRVFRAPSNVHESSCHEIQANVVEIVGGAFDGVPLVTVAWMPTAEELAELNAGNPVFLSCIGGLPPHYLTTSFSKAVTPL